MAKPQGHPYLHLDTLPEDRDHSMRAMLRLGPWAWPQSGPGRIRARQLMRTSTPQATPGQVLLLSHHPTQRQSTVWLADLDRTRVPTPRASFVGHARQAWEDACRALPHALPLLWTSLYDLQQQLPSAWAFGTHNNIGALVDDPAVLDGPSFGLSFGLMLASRLLHQALPEDIAASACLSASGELAPIEGLPDKLRALATFAPGVRRMLVHTSQAQEPAPQGVTLHGVQTLADALTLLFPDLAHIQGRWIAREDRAQQVTTSLFHLTLHGQHQIPHWEPVKRTATHLLKHHPQDSAQTERLRFVTAVATRHSSQPEPMPRPSLRWLQGVPQPLRLRVLAHSLQHAAGAAPTWGADALEQAYQLLPPMEDAFPDHLRLQGAMARLYAVRGPLRQALTLHKSTTLAWFEHLAPAEASFSLSAWIHLAAALKDQESFAHALESRTRFEARGGLRDYNHPFMDLAQARAHILYGERDKAAPLLAPWVHEHRLAYPLRLRTWRLHAQLTTQEASRSRQRLAQAAKETPLAALHQSLLSLSPYTEEVEDLESLCQHSPGPSQQLTNNYPTAHKDEPEAFPNLHHYLWRCFPY